ncbi:hypothetical protein M3I53_05560 [Paraburkholderia sp. CNPSo 3272]|uniref:hypothetical protein n=1 Tax=Paraburkholderia sp. CNPSo 3272 TaxID=2940931 RepID=UPI0020B761DF|nr:hypothetical protein [Paraburkholderia sp. CNPSo 3272]MCP3722605.1 hypothetical protein [Paraburkholderia sp. CNPSo 3272]
MAVRTRTIGRTFSRDSASAGAAQTRFDCGRRVRRASADELQFLLPHIHGQQGIVSFLDAEISKLDELKREAQRNIILLNERRAVPNCRRRHRQNRSARYRNVFSGVADAIDQGGVWRDVTADLIPDCRVGRPDNG